MHIAHSNLKSYNVYFKCFFFLASARQNLDFVHKRSFVLIWPLPQFLVCLQSAKPKRAAILFYKKVGPRLCFFIVIYFNLCVDREDSLTS